LALGPGDGLVLLRGGFLGAGFLLPSAFRSSKSSSADLSFSFFSWTGSLGGGDGCLLAAPLPCCWLCCNFFCSFCSRCSSASRNLARASWLTDASRVERGPPNKLMKVPLPALSAPQASGPYKELSYVPRFGEPPPPIECNALCRSNTQLPAN
jgi:hypothetical protein